MDSQYNIKLGWIYRTPYEPAGLFRVTEIEQGWPYGETAFGFFFGDQPRGYRDGTVGRYPSKELQGREQFPAPAKDHTDA